MSTQIIQAKQGIITPEMHEVAYKEKVDADWLRNEIALAYDFVYGIEKDYRLVKTAKVSCFLIHFHN